MSEPQNNRLQQTARRLGRGAAAEAGVRLTLRSERILGSTQVAGRQRIAPAFVAGATCSSSCAAPSPVRLRPPPAGSQIAHQRSALAVPRAWRGGRLLTRRSLRRTGLAPGFDKRAGSWCRGDA